MWPEEWSSSSSWCFCLGCLRPGVDEKLCRRAVLKRSLVVFSAEGKPLPHHACCTKGGSLLVAGAAFWSTCGALVRGAVGLEPATGRSFPVVAGDVCLGEVVLRADWSGV